MKAFDDFKNKQQKCMKYIYIYKSIYKSIYKFIQYAIHLDKTKMLKKFLRTK